MSRLVRHACTAAGLLGACLFLPVLANAQAPQQRPMQWSPMQPPPVYPGLESNPFYPGWPWFPAPPAASSARPGYGSATPSPDMSNPYAPPKKPDDKLFSAGAYDQHEPLLRGLYELNMRQVKVGPRDVVNVRRKMGSKELWTLVESVNADRRIFFNAERLAARLVERGLLHPGDRVVGYANGKVYAIVTPP